MRYLFGTPQNFHDFVNLISAKDKIGIFSHTDVDGLASAVFLTKILESKNLKVDFLEFFNYEVGILKKKFKGKLCDKLFLTDWYADEFEEDLDYLRKKSDVLVFDHHPLNENLKNKKGIIKTESSYCSAHALFDLAKNYFDVKDLENLFYASLIFDYTITDERVLKILKEKYPKITKENVFESEPGRFGKKIDNALNYHISDIKKVYDLVLENDLSSFDEINKIVEKDIIENEKRFMKKAEYFSDKNLHFGYFNPKFAKTSTIISKLSYDNPDKIFVMVSDIKEKKDDVKVSSRYQKGDLDLGEILHQLSKNLEGSTFGGHAKAAGGSFPKKYLGEFKKLLLKSL